MAFAAADAHMRNFSLTNGNRRLREQLASLASCTVGGGVGHRIQS